MEIPMSLKRLADGRLSYGIPLWYRLMTAAMIAIVAAGGFSTGEAPGLVAWIVIALLTLGLLYEERWLVDPKAALVVHREGLLPFAKTGNIAFADIQGVRLAAFARGTVPGSQEEASDKSLAFELLQGKPEAVQIGRPALLKSPKRKPHIQLLIDTRDGDSWLVDSLPARSAKRLKIAGAALAEACGVSFTAGE